MDSDPRACAEAWLRYGNELGLGPYYRDRASGISAPADCASAVMVTEIIADPESSIPALTAQARPAASASAHSASAPSAPDRATDAVLSPRVSPDRPLARPVIGPVLGVSPLFDERIEGDSLERIREDIGPNCTRCKLHKGRTKIVFGVGNPKAELVFVGEGPGRDEDAQGEPFVGRAGKLLTQMIEAMSLRREDVYIANVVKCRPPENRLPEKDEIITCSPYLMRQLAVISPKVICCLGSCSAQTLLQTTQGISRFRGEWFDFRGSKLIATYHPAYLLRNPAAKGEVWKDLQKVMAVLGLQPKKR